MTWGFWRTGAVCHGESAMALWPWRLRIWNVAWQQNHAAARFSRMPSEGSRFTWGVAGWDCVRRKLCLWSQPSATVRNRPQPSLTPVTYHRIYFGVCRGGVSVSDLCRCSYNWFLQRKCLCVWSAASHLYWRLQTRCLCERSVSPLVSVICGVAVSSAFAREVSESVICGVAVVLAFAEEVSVSLISQFHWRWQMRSQCQWSVK